jgi:hypothetical protein
VTGPAAAGPAASGNAGANTAAPAPSGGVVSLGQVVAPPDFDPNAALVAMKPQFLDCYNKARATNPTLHGKIKLKIQVSPMGTVTGVDADPADPAYDPSLIVCLGDAMKAASFPKRGSGTATIFAPMVFRP